MTEVHDQQLSLDLSSVADQLLPGYRLRRLEVYNWGTFNGKVWRLNLEGHNGLLTGDIGSGKSTIVDAITTLLVPRAQYNKAAGADNKERSIKSYVLGFYKSERNDSGGSAKPVALRDNNQFSVILGVFHNAGYNSTITLAQVFWMKDHNAPPARIYIGAERELSIQNDFSNFRGDIASLRKQLGIGYEMFDSFKGYGAWFRRRFGIEHEQALELFHQTISMKSVSNLTDFVRTHMLEESDVRNKIDDLLNHFDDLTKAHDAVLKAKKQVELLTPLVDDCHRSAEISARKEELRMCRDTLKTYFAKIKCDLLQQRLAGLRHDWERQNETTLRLENQLNNLRFEQSKVQSEIAANGGNRIEQLRVEIEQAHREELKRKDQFARYEKLVADVGHEPANDADVFSRKRALFASERENASEREVVLQNGYTEVSVNMREQMKEHAVLADEITHLKSRRSNIPREQVAIRQRLCEAINVDCDEMPFAGELLQVREEERDWEGAVERLLRNFGMSILVPDVHYDAVSRWVDQNHLKGRLVYFRVRPKVVADGRDIHPRSLAHKISIRPDSPFYDWVEREILHRADLICCDTHDEFRRETKAITRAGQIKKPGEQHEKDDRFRLDDRSRFVLGWTNEAKIYALEKQAKGMETQIQSLADRLSGIQREREIAKALLDSYSKLEEYRDFDAIDWHSLAQRIVALQQEKEQLENASDLLKELNSRLEVLNQEVEKTAEKANEQRDKRSKTEGKLEQYQDQLRDAEQLLVDAPPDFATATYEALDSVRAEALGEKSVTIENANVTEQAVREWLQARMDSEERKLRTVNDRIVKAMTSYNTAFPLETQEVDANVDSAGEYENMLASLRADDLPRFEAQFKALLNENTIREVANFQSQLNRQQETIKERIARINESLTKIDYNAGRYIVLEAQASNDIDIKNFRLDLKSCTEGTLTGSDDAQYSEAKFLQVKQIVERFRGREGHTDGDKKWTARVTDVRNWFTFAASERWREDHKEYEHYSDSGGKSGGQKEKLAYTILAASLAYQFGLEWGAARSRSFRFVVIDEAFGRGSDESAQYGLNLFAQLNLQLLVVTPLQKIHIIEPFVSSVGYVQNEDGSSSKLRNLTIEQYQEEKARNLRNELDTNS